ncbi:vWA domain-containing protein [Paraliomyxa miuraensis]|uniref:vWA domain-containing protein n=1 Tax=Paraliomyxa miuraensis TaxID=376150 RepID=UPI002251EC6F|nr:vWA domain-containing protein [Paraliomyxa miuraensis]MCX4246042.1 VWA domain-containing protein [Paraliomyxa miuraensis]
MRRQGLISILVLVTAGCSASGDDLDSYDRPDGVGGLVDELDPAVDGGGYGILLIDVTSSMTTVRSSTGNTRCYDAKIMARGIINDFFDPTKVDGDGIAIWGFANDDDTSDDVQPTITGYYTDAVSAKNAVNALSCEGSTPLADALCKGVNGDGETFTISPMLNRMYVLTDGFENNSNGECSGPSGSINNQGTWQYKVWAEMQSVGIMVDTRYWVDPTALLSPTKIDDFAAPEDEPADPSLDELQIVADIEGLSQSKIDQLMGTVDAAGGVYQPPEPECDVTCQELSLFKALAQEFGGSWGVVADDDPQYPIEETMDPATGPVHPDINEPPPPPPQQIPGEVGG